MNSICAHITTTTLPEPEARRTIEEVGYVALRLVDGGQGVQVVGSRTSDLDQARADAERAVREMPGVDVAVMRCHSVMREAT